VIKDFNGIHRKVGEEAEHKKCEGTILMKVAEGTV
jgi:hypothetical protein